MWRHGDPIILILCRVSRTMLSSACVAVWGPSSPQLLSHPEALASSACVVIQIFISLLLICRCTSFPTRVFRLSQTSHVSRYGTVAGGDDQKEKLCSISFPDFAWGSHSKSVAALSLVLILVLSVSLLLWLFGRPVTHMFSMKNKNCAASHFRLFLGQLFKVVSSLPIYVSMPVFKPVSSLAVHVAK